MKERIAPRSGVEQDDTPQANGIIPILQSKATHEQARIARLLAVNPKSQILNRNPKSRIGRTGFWF